MLSSELLAGLAERWGELAPYAVAGAGATYACGDSLMYIVTSQKQGPPSEYLVDEETLDELLQADSTFLAFVGSGPDDCWTIPSEEAAYLIEGRMPQAAPDGRRAWRYRLAREGERWLLRAESNPRESVDVTVFHNRAPKG